LTPDETSFYERAEEIKVGVTLATVKQKLGEPSRVHDAEQHCIRKGGHREWVYESFDAAGGRKPLRAGSFAFCADQNGVIVAIYQIVI
jgi:hypothetical protein